MLCLIISLACLTLLGRIAFVFWQMNKSHITKITERSVKTLVVLGSGGHTGEMLKMIDKFDPVRYSPRIYVLAATDRISLERLDHMEKLKGGEGSKATYQIEVIPRTREVGQSYISSVFTTLWASIFSAAVVARHRPALILTNGPGTCVPLCFAALIFRILGICRNRIVFVESICRVRSLSLSGRILYWFTDDFFVHWKKLKDKYPKTKFMGRLV